VPCWDGKFRSHENIEQKKAGAKDEWSKSTSLLGKVFAPLSCGANSDVTYGVKDDERKKLKIENFLKILTLLLLFSVF